MHATIQAIEELAANNNKAINHRIKEVHMPLLSIFSVDQMTTAFAFAKVNLAPTIIGDRLIDGPTPNLVFYTLETSHYERKFYAITPNRSYMPKLVETCMTLFSQIFANNL